MHYKNRILLLIISVLTIVVIILGWLNKEQATQIDEQTVIIINQGQTYSIHLDDIKQFSAVQFDAYVKATGKEAVLTSFTGVPLMALLNFYSIEVEDSSKIYFKAIDGYQTHLNGHEVKQVDNVFIVYMRNQIPSGSKANGGTGPLEMVIAQDTFSQRWVKYLIEIRIMP